jgi:hypothetical protein
MRAHGVGGARSGGASRGRPKASSSAVRNVRARCRALEERRRQLAELRAVLDNGVESEAGLQRLRAAEGRLRADITATQSLNAQRRGELEASGSAEYRSIQVCHEVDT